MSKATIESTTSSLYAAAKLPGTVALELAETAHCQLNTVDEDGIGTSKFATTESPAMAASSSPMKAVVAATRSINGRTQISSPGQRNIGSASARKRLQFSPNRDAVPQSREVAPLSPCRDVDSQSWGEAQIIAEAQLIVELQIVTVNAVSIQ